MADNKALAESIRNYLESGADLLLTDNDYKVIIEALEQEPKRGHWMVEIWNNREHHTCSECDRVVAYEPCYHYCPNCGARMESEVSE